MSINVNSSNSANIQDSATKVEATKQKIVASENRLIEESSKASEKEVKAQLQEWTSKINVTISEKVKFNFSDELGSIYVTVVDNETQEVIRTIPKEDAIKLSAIWKEAVGNIFDKKG